ncbi:MAG TPA: hypothetical protein VGO33_03205 [Gemmatimonadaceae bacterium]|jgi:hypothetical protein|nr:hypothetical protein [Gemmatimonadaceae bacterium]
MQAEGALLKAIAALLDGLVDYAGLFPPASEDMRPALEGYASYIASPEKNALGRFIVPLPRLKELEDAGADLFPRGRDSEPWRLSVLVADDVRAAGAEMLTFNRHHSSGSRAGHVVIDVVELKASTTGEIESQREELPRSFTAYFEIPTKGDVASLVKALARAGSRAKIRTGGVTPEAFPPAQEIIDFISACRGERVAFKATAGLHHPVRGTYKLTYEPNAPTGKMYGFLNVFMAATLAYAGETEDAALAVLQEEDPLTFSFADDAIVWRDKRIDVEQIQASRADFAISFGSCSFREPVDEIESLSHATRLRNQ